ncbi:MAG: PPOX class F420-dependent oxidoreductase [Candidatus Nitrosocosmicus sp.]
MNKMTDKEIRDFLSHGTYTAKLSTVRTDGRPHIAPIWFVLDNNGDIVFTTWKDSIKAKNINLNPHVSICIDDQKPPFSFVIVEGIVKIIEEPNNILQWATKIAARYMGKENADVYGKRNSVKGELLLRIKPSKIIAQKNIAK